MLHNPDDLAGVAELVVVPEVEDRVVALDLGGSGVHDRGVARADEVAGDRVGRADEVDLALERRGQRHVAEVAEDLVAGGLAPQPQAEDRDRDVRHRHTDRAAGDPRIEVGQCLGDGRGGTGLGDDHVERRRASAAVGAVVIVQQVLVVGERVDGLHVTAQHAELVRHGLQRRDDRVGGAGRAGKDLLVRLDHVVVDAVDDVGHVTLARSGQNDLGNTGAKVLREALTVAPLAGVVDEDGVLDAVRRVVDLGRVAGVDHLDLVAVGDDRAVRLVNGDRALELAVDGVTAQQRRALDQVLDGPAAAPADDDGAQAQAVAGAGLLDEQTGDEAADATEAVEDDVPGLATLDLVGTRGTGYGFGGELLHREAAVVGAVRLGEQAEVDLGRTEIKGGQSLKERQRVGDREFHTGDLPGEPVGLEDADHRLVHQGAAVQQDRDVPLPLQLPDDRDHRLRDLLAVLPVGERVVVDSHRIIFRARRCSDGNVPEL